MINKGLAYTALFLSIIQGIAGGMFLVFILPKLSSIYESLAMGSGYTPFLYAIVLFLLAVINFISYLANMTYIFKSKTKTFNKLGKIFGVLSFIITVPLIMLLVGSTLTTLYSLTLKI